MGAFLILLRARQKLPQWFIPRAPHDPMPALPSVVLDVDGLLRDSPPQWQQSRSGL